MRQLIDSAVGFAGSTTAKGFYSADTFSICLDKSSDAGFMILYAQVGDFVSAAVFATCWSFLLQHTIEPRQKLTTYTHPQSFGPPDENAICTANSVIRWSTRIRDVYRLPVSGMSKNALQI